MEAEIAHLKQENGILRDAVSNTTNQLESKQSAELNKLRQDCGRLVSELNEKTGKLQQEGVQKKNAEQAATQLKVQLQEAERRWEEVQSYIRKRTAEHEAAQQDLQSKFVAKENEVQSLHSAKRPWGTHRRGWLSGSQRLSSQAATRQPYTFLLTWS